MVKRRSGGGNAQCSEEVGRMHGTREGDTSKVQARQAAGSLKRSFKQSMSAARSSARGIAVRQGAVLRTGG